MITQGMPPGAARDGRPGTLLEKRIALLLQLHGVLDFVVMEFQLPDAEVVGGGSGWLRAA